MKHPTQEQLLNAAIMLDGAHPAVAAMLERMAEARPFLLDVVLYEDAAAFLRDTIGEDGSPIRLMVGHGHSGFGLYVAAAEYQEDGANLLCTIPPLDQQPTPAPQPACLQVDPGSTRPASAGLTSADELIRRYIRSLIANDADAAAEATKSMVDYAMTVEPNAVLVEGFSQVALGKLNALQSKGYAINGVSIATISEAGETNLGAVTTGGRVLWWPQQPAMQAAEPVDADRARFIIAHLCNTFPELAHCHPARQQQAAEPVATVVEELEHDGQGWCAKVRWIFNPVPVGETLSWGQPK